MKNQIQDYLDDQYSYTATEKQMECILPEFNRLVGSGEIFQAIYSIDEWAQLNNIQKKIKRSCPVIQINAETGETIEHASYYQATKSLSISKNCCGNISVAAKNGKVAYGFKWKIKI